MDESAIHQKAAKIMKATLTIQNTKEARQRALEILDKIMSGPAPGCS